MEGNNKDSTAEALQGWRLNPAESHSDWEFEIASTGDDNGAVTVSAPYHTHKYVLSCGKRKSTYFESMFHGGFAETGVTTRRRRCRIELPARAAEAVPVMLDYSYFPEEPLQIDTESAAPLYFLSDYFGNDCMRKEVIGFVKKDLSWENCSVYHRQTKLVPSSDAILLMVIQFCADKIQCIDRTLEIMNEADLKFWLMVFENVMVDKFSTKKYFFNLLIDDICHRNIDNITAAEFHELTKEANLPWVDPDHANQFLMLQSTLMDKQEEEEEGGGELGDATTGDDGEDNKLSTDKDHLSLDWISKLDLLYHEEDDKDEDMDYTPGEEEDYLEEGEEWDVYSQEELLSAVRSHLSVSSSHPEWSERIESEAKVMSYYEGFKDVSLSYDDDIEENELLNLKEENIQQQKYDVDVYFDEGYDTDDNAKLTLRCIKSLCLNWEQVSGNLAYFHKRPEMLSLLYRGALAVARKREQAWQMEKESLIEELPKSKRKRYLA